MNVVFATTELDPVVPGGAGTLIAGLAGRLSDAGHDVRVVLVTDRSPEPTPVDTIWVGTGETDWEAPTPFLTASRAAAEAIARLDPAPDLVEFIDFHGLGYWTLMRREVLGLQRVPVAVRLHGPLDLILDTMDVVPADQAAMRLMEAEAYRMADAVIVPSPAFAAVVAQRFGVEAERVRVGEPPIPTLVPFPRRPAGHPEIVCFGRLGEVKGSADFLEAVLPLLRERTDLLVRFVGPDGWDTARHQSFQATLQERVPELLRNRVRFEGPVARHDIGTALSTAWAVVIPSRFESFCLAAHEVRSLGHPLVLPNLPAFRPYFSEATGAACYDGSVEALTATLAGLLDSPGRLERLAAAPPPGYADPLDPYSAVEPRHPNSQSGLATAAFQRVEAAVRPPETGPEPSRKNRLLRSGLDRLPEPAAAALEHRLRQFTRFNAVNSWRIDRARTGWLRDTMDELQRNVGEVAAPEISVVIPCYNHGEFLHDAILSIFRQDFDSWEIVVVDDGSTDRETLRTLGGLRYPRTRVLRQENRGLPAARNAGMRAARGRYFVPLDSDDELGAGYLSVMHAALTGRPDAAMAHCWPRLFGEQNLVWVNRPYNPYQLLLANSLVGCVMMRSSAWLAVGGYDETMRAGNEDWDLWVRFMECGWDQVEVPKPLFRYRKHGISMSVTTLARFETARTEMMAAHPALYAEPALRERKAEWYPLVTVVVGGDPGALGEQTLDDVAVVPIGPPSPVLGRLANDRGWPVRPAAADLGRAIHDARGKYVIVWDPVREASPTLLDELAAALEEADDAYVAWPRPDAHPALWRRWALLDPHADLQKPTVVDVAGDGPPLAEQDFLGAFPHPRWAVDPGAFDVPVRRVRPETEGRFPTWAR